ncbi:hypothetical protein [Weissella ceti]|uniref:Uncharacterized protein n=1 Tax=Weissella ceti TaxID=759620 RepID=A0A088GHB8_9LACO|nr:hypothetical protein [Weissella ceti]AIM63065.1 hypothetical protein WS74_0813 [Weissella ceti]
MTLAQSGFGKKSAESFVVDAGVIYKNLKFDKQTQEWSGELLGATNGGVEVTTEKKYRKMEVDGTAVMDVKGLNVVESAQATFKANLKELTAENLILSMNGKEVATDEYGDGVRVIEDRYLVVDGDYIDNMAVVGFLSGTGEPIIFMLDNVLITSPLSLKTEDGSEAELELTGQANGTYEQLQQRKSPYRIIYPKTKDKKTVTALDEPKTAKSK